MARKVIKPVETEIDVAAATPPAESDLSDATELPTVAPIEPPVMLTADDHGKPDGHVLAVAGLADSAEPTPPRVWKPGSCINCGETTTDVVQVIAPDRYRCTRCQHEWTLADEQAPFRRLARG